jgi:hypothetical protein
VFAVIARERDDLLTMAVALVAVPTTWWLLLGWSWSRPIAGHDDPALIHNLLSIREMVATGDGWSALVYRPEALGGFKGRDAGGAFPLFPLLAAVGLAPAAVSAVSAFLVSVFRR